jgi:drug/metabolite transporter (DMT)-like permease
MSRKALLLFLGASLIWGSSFLLIRVAVRDISPSAVASLPPQMPSETSLLALIILGIVNTGLLSWVYFALVREAGAAVTSLITYVVPVVALTLGVSLLGEHLTAGAVAGLVLIAAGTWLASSGPVIRR